MTHCSLLCSVHKEVALIPHAFLPPTCFACPACPLPDPVAANSSYVRLRYKARAISAYSPEPVPTSGVQRLGCGFGWLDPSFSGAYIGVGSSAFSGGTACGRCVEVQCDDQACSDPGSSLVVQIVDLCGESPPLMQAAARPGNGAYCTVAA